MRLLITKISVLDKKDHYVEIKVLKDSKRIEQIKADSVGQEKGAQSILINIMSLAFPTNTSSQTSLMQVFSPILLKGDN